MHVKSYHYIKVPISLQIFSDYYHNLKGSRTSLDCKSNILLSIGYLVLVDPKVISEKYIWRGETIPIRLKSAETIIALSQIRVSFFIPLVLVSNLLTIMSGIWSLISCAELCFIRTQEKRICKNHEGGKE